MACPRKHTGADPYLVLILDWNEVSRRGFQAEVKEHEPKRNDSSSEEGEGLKSWNFGSV